MDLPYLLSELAQIFFYFIGTQRTCCEMVHQYVHQTTLFMTKCTTADVWARPSAFCREEAAWSDKTSAMMLVIVLPKTGTCNRKTKRAELSFHDQTHVISCSSADFGRSTTIHGHQF